MNSCHFHSSTDSSVWWSISYLTAVDQPQYRLVRRLTGWIRLSGRAQHGLLSSFNLIGAMLSGRWKMASYQSRSPVKHIDQNNSIPSGFKGNQMGILSGFLEWKGLYGGLDCLSGWALKGSCIESIEVDRAFHSPYWKNFTPTLGVLEYNNRIEHQLGLDIAWSIDTAERGGQ